MIFDPDATLKTQKRFPCIATGESGEGLCFDEVGEIVIVPGGGFESQSD